MSVLRRVEVKFWYLWVGVVLFVATGSLLQLIQRFTTGDHIRTVHSWVGYGVFYVDMIAPMFVGCLVVIPLLVIIKRIPTPAEALLTCLPMMSLHTSILVSDGLSPTQIQSTIINFLLIYLMMRLIIPWLKVDFSVLDVKCNRYIYPAILFGIMICLPAAVMLFYGKIWNSPKVHGSYIATGLASAIFVVTKLRGGKTMEVISIVTIVLVAISMALIAVALNQKFALL